MCSFMSRLEGNIFTKDHRNMAVQRPTSSNLTKSLAVVTIVTVASSFFLWFYPITRPLAMSLKQQTDHFLQTPDSCRLGPLHLVIASCGDTRLEEALNLLKSTVMFTKTFLTIHMFTDSELQRRNVTIEIESWPSEIQDMVKFNILDASFPADVSCTNCSKGLQWHNFFKPCAAQRLFLGDVMPDVDSVVYVDTDALFLAPIEELWASFLKFNSTQFLGVAPDSDDESIGYYIDNHAKNIPLYGPTGMNSGVLLMNLTRIRTSNWARLMAKYWIEYKDKVVGDNDLINIYLHYNPERAFLITCDWNYHIWQCTRCDQGKKTGVAILHSTSNTFFSNFIPPFKAVYLAFNQFKLGKHTLRDDLLPTMKKNLNEAKPPHVCGRYQWVYTWRIENLIPQD